MRGLVILLACVAGFSDASFPTTRDAVVEVNQRMQRTRDFHLGLQGLYNGDAVASCKAQFTIYNDSCVHNSSFSASMCQETTQGGSPASGACNSNNVTDNGETGVDCGGGGCPACAGNRRSTANSSWVRGVWTPYPAGDKDAYVCFNNSWTKSCFKCTGWASSDPLTTQSPSDITSCIRKNGTWGIDPNITDEDTCQDTAKGRWSEPRSFKSGEQIKDPASAGGIMPDDASCSTGPYTTIEKWCVKDDQFFTDLAAGLTPAAAMAANPTYYGGSAAGMFRGTPHLTNPAMAMSPNATTPPMMAFLDTICFAPIVWARNEGSMLSQVHPTDGHVLIIEPVNYANAKVIDIQQGKATVLGGSNAGNIMFRTNKPVRLWGVQNSGSVAFSKSQDIVVGDVVNSGAITFSNTTQALLNVSNTGNVTGVGGSFRLFAINNNGTCSFTGGLSQSSIIEDVVNRGTITYTGNSVNAQDTLTLNNVTNFGRVTVTGGAFIFANITNNGIVTVNSGTVAGSIQCNTGTITLDSAVTGTMQVQSSACTGGTINAGGVTVTYLTGAPTSGTGAPTSTPSTPGGSTPTTGAPTGAPTKAPTGSPTPAPTPQTTTTTVSQVITVTSVANVSAYTGDVKKVYEVGYGITVGVYNSTNNSFKSGCNVLSTANSARRAGVAIAFEATVEVVGTDVSPIATAAQAAATTLASDSSTLVSGLANAKTSLNKASVAVPTSASEVAQIATPTVVSVTSTHAPTAAPIAATTAAPTAAPTVAATLATSSSSSGTMLIVIIAAVAAVVVLGGIGLAAYCMMGSKKDNPVPVPTVGAVEMQDIKTQQ